MTHCGKLTQTCSDEECGDASLAAALHLKDVAADPIKHQGEG
jgi:hypothetical protein